MTEPEHINERLILGLRSGEEDSFNELFKLYGPRIYRFGLAYLKNKSDAEELMQDVFMRIWEKRKNIDVSRNFKSYIYKIAVNSIYDLIRKKNIEKAFLDFTRENFQPGVETLWHEVIWNDMLSRLNSLMDKLPKQRKTVFMMSREDGLSNQQIADKLNLSKRTVENQIFRAINYLKKHMGSTMVFLMLFYFLDTQPSNFFN